MASEFATVDQEISRRFSELRLFWTGVKQAVSAPPAPQTYEYTAGVGFTIVFLYASLEFSLNRSVRQLAQLITDYSVRAADVCSPLMCLVHDPKVQAVTAAGKKTRLQTRLGLFNGVRSVEIAKVHDELLTPELQNVWAKSIFDTFLVFGVSGSPMVDPVSASYIDRIVNDRNAVAHGREAPDQVGSRYTVADVENLITRVESQARYFVSSFQQFFDGREFINASCRSRYLRRDAKNILI